MITRPSCPSHTKTVRMHWFQKNCYLSIIAHKNLERTHPISMRCIGVGSLFDSYLFNQNLFFCHKWLITNVVVWTTITNRKCMCVRFGRVVGCVVRSWGNSWSVGRLVGWSGAWTRACQIWNHAQAYMQDRILLLFRFCGELRELLIPYGLVDRVQFHVIANHCTSMSHPTLWQHVRRRYLSKGCIPWLCILLALRFLALHCLAWHFLALHFLSFAVLNFALLSFASLSFASLGLAFINFAVLSFATVSFAFISSAFLNFVFLALHFLAVPVLALQFLVLHFLALHFSALHLCALYS